MRRSGHRSAVKCYSNVTGLPIVAACHARPGSRLAQIDFRQKSLSQSESDKLDIRADGELVLDERMQVRHCLGADVKRRGNIIGRLLGKQHAQNLEFAGCENVGSYGFAGKVTERELMINVRT